METNARHTETRNSAAPNCGNSDEKTHYGLESLDQKSEVSNISGI